MKLYLKNFSYEEMEDIHEEVKTTVCERTKQMLNDLAAILDFAVEE